MATDISENEQIGEINKYDFRTETKGVFKARKGLDREIVGQISASAFRFKLSKLFKF